MVEMVITAPLIRLPLVEVVAETMETVIETTEKTQQEMVV
jgi:hypothetical protein